MNSLKIYPDPYAPPDFYSISDWHNPRETAKPEWHSVIKLFDAYYAHPSIIEKLESNTDASTF